MTIHQTNFQKSQSYSLGLGTAVAGVAHNLVGQAARNLTLGQLNLIASNANSLTPTPAAPAVLPGGLASYGNHGQVTAIAVQGASLMVSNQPVPLRMFSPIAQDGENNFIGLAIPNAGVVTVTTANVTGGPALTGGIFCDAYNESVSGPIQSPDALGSTGGLNFVAGMGQVISVGGLGVPQTVQLNCQLLRGVTLGWLYLEAFDAAAAVQSFAQEDQLSISQIMINQVEMLGSQVNAVVPFSQFTLGSTDSDARYLGMSAPLNSTCTISIIVPAGVPALTIQGGFFCAHQ